MILRYFLLSLLLLWIGHANAFAPMGLPGVSFAKIRSISRNDLVMRERKCDIAGTRRNKANAISKSKQHTRKFQLVNLQYKRLWWIEGNAFVRMRISTRTLKTIKKNGLHATAKKYGIDLRKFVIEKPVAPGTVPNPMLQYGEVKMKWRLSSMQFKNKMLEGLSKRGMGNLPAPMAAAWANATKLADETGTSPLHESGAFQIKRLDWGPGIAALHAKRYAQSAAPETEQKQEE